jgi:hypothetical protein
MTKEAPSGIYYSDGTFASQEDIRRKFLLEELDTTARVDQLTAPTRTFQEWTNVMVRRQTEREEVLPLPEYVKVQIATEKPILLALMADDHIGGEGTDYKRIGHDLDLIKSVGGYSITFGDLTNSAFFMPDAGDQIGTGEEQVLYARTMLGELARDGHLLAGWGGDHDLWGKDKGGAHTMYHEFRERYNAHYLEGVSYLTIELASKEGMVAYPLVGAHKTRGFSIYNDAHASWRMQLDDASGTDDIMSVTAHNHVKAYLVQTRKVYGGKAKMIHAIALGAYKGTDRYSRKMGWHRQTDKSMGAFGVILYPNQPKLSVHWTIAEAVEELQRT